MVFCNQCGRSNPDDAKFCSGCGSELSKTEVKSNTQNEIKSYVPNVESPKTKKKLPLWKKVVIGFLIFSLWAFIGSMITDAGSETTTEAEVTETTKAINENVKLLMDTTGYKQSVCKKIYNKLKKCGYAEIGELTDLGYEGGVTKSYKVTGNYYGSGMLIVAEDDLYFFSWGSDTLYDSEKPDTFKNIKDYAVTSSTVYGYMDAVEETVLNLLKAPSTADFPGQVWEGDQWGISIENGIISISSYVDAQNAFGAMVRSPFYAQFDISTGDGIYLTLDGEVYIDKR